MDDQVPLVVPEVNPQEVKNRPKGIISNPNCTTLSMIVAMGALHRQYILKELVVASYQAASGAGQSGLDTLREQMNEVANTAVGDEAGDIRDVIKDNGPLSVITFLTSPAVSPTAEFATSLICLRNISKPL